MLDPEELLLPQDDENSRRTAKRSALALILMGKPLICPSGFHLTLDRRTDMAAATAKNGKAVLIIVLLPSIVVDLEGDRC